MNRAWWILAQGGIMKPYWTGKKWTAQTETNKIIVTLIFEDGSECKDFCELQNRLDEPYHGIETS